MITGDWLDAQVMEEGKSLRATKCKKPLLPISQRGKGEVGSPEEARTITGLSLGAGATEDVQPQPDTLPQAEGGRKLLTPRLFLSPVC